MTAYRRILVLVLASVLGGCGLYDSQLYLDREPDGGGDAGDPNDPDGDGVASDVDICPSVADAAQRDFDADGVGDACDPDGDGDGVDDPAVAAGQLRYVEALDFLIQDVCVDGDDAPVADDPYDCAARGLRVRSHRLDEALPTIRHDAATEALPHGGQASASVPVRLHGGRLGVLSLLDARAVGPDGEARAYREFDRYGVFSATNPVNTPMTDAPLDGYVLTELAGLTASIIGRCDESGGAVPVQGQSPGDASSCVFDDAWVVAALDAVPEGGASSTTATFRAAPICTGNFDRAFTEWRIIEGFELSSGKTMDALVSDHYAAETADEATSFERTYYTRPYGRTRFERWSKTGPAVTEGCDGATTEGDFFRVACQEWSVVEAADEGYDVRAWPVDSRIARGNLLVNHDFGAQGTELAGWQRSSATGLEWERAQEAESGALGDGNRYARLRWVDGLAAPYIYQDIPRSALQVSGAGTVGIGGRLWAGAPQKLSVRIEYLNSVGAVVSSELVGDQIEVDTSRRLWSETFTPSTNASVTTLRVEVVPVQGNIDYFVDDLWLTVVQ